MFLLIQYIKIFQIHLKRKKKHIARECEETDREQLYKGEYFMVKV